MYTDGDYEILYDDYRSSRIEISNLEDEIEVLKEQKKLLLESIWGLLKNREASVLLKAIEI